MFSYNKLYRKNHRFQLIEPSYIPIVLSICVFSFVYNLIVFMHSPTYFKSIFNQLNLLILIIIINWWFMSMRNESNRLFVYTKEVENNILMGMLLFITSEIFLFVSVFWAFFHSSLCPSIFIGSVWPPFGIKVMSPWGLPLLNTLILLISGITVNSFFYALKILSFCPTSVFSKFGVVNFRRVDSLVVLSSFLSSKNNFFQFIIQKSFFDVKFCWILIYRHLFVTILLGLFFLSVQLYEYIHAFFSISDGIYGSVFFMSTGLHGLHVLLGLVLLSSCFIRVCFGDFDVNPSVHLTCTCSVWYWHFVDVVWLFLFIFVYIWGS